MLRTDRDGATVIRSAFAESIDLSCIYRGRKESRHTPIFWFAVTAWIALVAWEPLLAMYSALCLASVCSSLVCMNHAAEHHCGCSHRKQGHSIKRIASRAHLEVGTVTVFWPVQRWWRPWRMWDDGCGGAGQELIDKAQSARKRRSGTKNQRGDRFSKKWIQLELIIYPTVRPRGNAFRARWVLSHWLSHRH